MKTQEEKRMTKDVGITNYIPHSKTDLGIEITIPKNATVEINESGLKKEFYVETVELLIGIGKNNTASLIMDIEAFEALKNGELLTFSTCR